MKVQFAYINEDYLLILKSVEPKIMNPDSYYPPGSEKKWTVGVLFEIGEMNYYAPVSSIKDHQISALDPNKLHPDLEKLCYPIRVKYQKIEKVAGLIGLDFMFPVIDYDLSLVLFNVFPEKYRLFLRTQNKYYLLHFVKIKDKALNIYNTRVYGLNPYYIKRCCNFRLLEQTLQDLIKQKGY